MRSLTCSLPSLLLLLLSAVTYARVLPAPWNVTIESLNMQHMLRWSPLQASCGTVNYTVQLQGQFELLYLDGSWVDAYECHQIIQNECDLTSDLASNSNYSICVQAGCGWRVSQRVCLGTTFNPSRDTFLLAPVLSVSLLGNVIQVGFSDRALAMTLTLVVWRRGDEQSASTHEIMPPQKSFYIAALQEGATYCLRAYAHLENSSKNSSTGTQCISIPSLHLPWLQPVTVSIAMVITVALAVAMGWSVTHCGPVLKHACLYKEPLPTALLDDWPVTTPQLYPEMPHELTHPVLLLQPTDRQNAHSKE